MVLYNCNSIAIIEVKFKAKGSDAGKTIKKAITFKNLYPEYKNHRIYLGLASMSFTDTVEERCIREGVAVIKQVGDTVVINDKHLKVF